MPTIRPQAAPAWLRRLALGGALGLAAVSASAAPTTYSGEAPVTSQSEAERSEALKTALADVVVRRSGDAAALARGDVARAVAEAGRYVLQYQYRRDVSADAAGAPQVHLTLVAEFDSAAVDRMLARLGLGGEAIAEADEPAGPLRVWIAGVRSAMDYARAIGSLERNGLVRELRVTEARADGLLVELTTTAGHARTLEALDAQGTLTVTTAAPPVDGIDATLALRP
ncbi:MAG: DUF2066 domain-containing protein [Xanthomonadales bacterium]|nr:DUF2066 domain-containing protein [Xanthomonadales bacterium]